MPSLRPQAVDSQPDPLGLHWDKVCDLLGGSDWSTIPEPFQSLPPLRSRFSSGRQFLFQDDPARLPLESLWLKLSAFVCLCHRVVEFYERQQRPYLSLDPRHVTVRASDHTVAWLPARWLFAVELDAAKGATSLVHERMSKEMARNIFLPSADLDAAYAAPVMRQWPMSREVSGRVLLRSVERIPDDTNEQVARGLLRAHVFSDGVSFSDFSDHDAIHVTFRLPGSGATMVCFWARRVEEAERGVVVSGVMDPISQAAWAQLERARQQVFSDARIVVYRAFHHACDLYSLGMLLFRSLLVNSSQSLEQVQQRLGLVLERLEPLVQGLNPDDHWTVFKRVSGRLQEQGGVFGPPSACLSEYIWYDALILGVRLVCWIPGFSFCTSAGAVDERVPEALQSAVRAAEHVAEQARIELFDAAVRHRDLLGVCDRALTERM